jgi:hypothetical protein
MNDLRALGNSGDVRVLGFPEYWHFATLSWFEGEYLALGAERQHFLRLFLSRYLSLVGADCIVSTSLWYKQDIPWGAAAESLGTPYLVFHKEGFKVTEGQQLTTMQRAKKVGQFTGSHLVVQNESIRRVLLDAGFVRPDRITALGTLRMDKLVTEGGRDRKLKQPLVTFFSFTHGVGLDELGYGQFPENPYVGWLRLFEQTHAAFARFAMGNPSVECVIKTKWGHVWFEYIDAALRANGLEAKAIPNLRITYEGDAHDLILRSKFVCGFNSTTLLEAGIAGIPVVVPVFAEAADPRYRRGMKLTPEELEEAFDVTRSIDEFEAALVRRLTNAKVDETCLDLRRVLFERWVSKLDGFAVSKYLDLLKKVCRRAIGSESSTTDPVPAPAYLA